MLPTEREQFQTVVSAHFSAYGRRVEDDAIPAWWDACKGLPMDAVKKALNAHAKRGKFPAKPVDVHEYVRAVSSPGHKVETCAFNDAGRRCPNRGHQLHGDRDPHLCIGHDELRNDLGASRRYLDLVLEKRAPFVPNRGDATLARFMGREKGERHYGARMYEWLDAHPDPKPEDYDFRLVVRAATNPHANVELM